MLGVLVPDEREGTMERHRLEVAVGCQQAKSVAEAQLGQQGVDRSDLDAASAAVVAERGGLDVILDLRRENGEQRELLHDPPRGGRPLETLEQFLEHDPGRDDDVAPLEALGEEQAPRARRGGCAAERQRPDAGVDEDVHERERSAL